MNSLVSEQKQFAYCSFMYRQPMECFENRSDVFMTRYPSNKSGGSVLHSLESVELYNSVDVFFLLLLYVSYFSWRQTSNLFGYVRLLKRLEVMSKHLR